MVICSFSTSIFLSRLDLSGNDVVSLSANHLQKLHFSFQLTTPHGHVFKPHQVCSCLLDLLNECHLNALFIEDFVVLQAFLKLRHETKVEHIFVVGNTGKKFEIILVKYLLLHIFLLKISYYIFYCLGSQFWPSLLVQLVTLYNK